MAKNKKILLIGCSNGLGLHNHFSTIYGTENKEYINLSAAAAGNFYIAGQLFDYINRSSDLPDYVYLQFTGLSRIDLSISSLWIGKYVFGKGHYTYNFESVNKKRRWLLSGGYYGSWSVNQEAYGGAKLMDDVFNSMYDIDDLQHTFEQSLKEIYSAVELCNSLKIKYNWTSYYDYTKPRDPDYLLDGTIDKMPSYIDMTHHLKNYPLDVGIEMGETWDDVIHYNDVAHLEFIRRNADKFDIIKSL